MEATIDIIDDELPVKRAAKAVRKRVGYVRDFIESGKVNARKTGGTEEHPRLVVSLSALQKAIREDTAYCPAGRPAPAETSGRTKLHPDALKMLSSKPKSPIRKAG